MAPVGNELKSFTAFRNTGMVCQTLPPAVRFSFLSMWVLRHLGIIDIQANIKSLEELRQAAYGTFVVKIWKASCAVSPKTNLFSPDVYGRMRWDVSAPTLTCRCFSISNGRYGHPESIVRFHFVRLSDTGRNGERANNGAKKKN